MLEIKVRLSLSVPGAQLLSEQECSKNPKISYNDEKVIITNFKQKGKNQKEITKHIVIKTRKQRPVIQNISICKEAYKYMLSTPTSTKFNKPTKRNKNGDVVERMWDTMSVHERLKKHFDLIAHDFRAISYNYEILED